MGFESKSSEQNFSGCCCADDKSDGMVDFGFKNEYHKEHIYREELIDYGNKKMTENQRKFLHFLVDLNEIGNCGTA